MSSQINGVLALMIIGSFLVAIMLHEAGHALVGFWFFILPFLAQLTGGSGFWLLRLPDYILSASLHLIAAVVGPSPDSFDLIRGLYFA